MTTEKQDIKIINLFVQKKKKNAEVPSKNH